MKRCMKSSQTLTQTDQSIDNNKITRYEPSRVMSGSSPAYRHLPSETTSTIFHALGKMHVLKVFTLICLLPLLYGFLVAVQCLHYYGLSPSD